jgi:predicted transcriptional regulator
MAKKPQKQQNLTIEQIEKALRKHNGVQVLAANELGVTRAAISARVKTSSKLKNVIEETKQRILDVSEAILFKKITDEQNMTALIFYLKCHGRDRGYVENRNVDIGNQDGKAFKVERVIVDVENDQDKD